MTRQKKVQKKVQLRDDLNSLRQSNAAMQAQIDQLEAENNELKSDFVTHTNQIRQLQYDKQDLELQLRVLLETERRFYESPTVKAKVGELQFVTREFGDWIARLDGEELRPHTKLTCVLEAGKVPHVVV